MMFASKVTDRQLRGNSKTVTETVGVIIIIINTFV